MTEYCFVTLKLAPQVSVAETWQLEEGATPIPCPEIIAHKSSNFNNPNLRIISTGAASENSFVAAPVEIIFKFGLLKLGDL